MSDETEKSESDVEPQRFDVQWGDIEEPQTQVYVDIASVRQNEQGFEFLFGSTHPISGKVSKVWTVAYNHPLDEFRRRNAAFSERLDTALGEAGLDPNNANTNLEQVVSKHAESERFYASTERASYHGPDAELRFAIVSPDKLQSTDLEQEGLDQVIRSELLVTLPTHLLYALFQEVLSW